MRAVLWIAAALLCAQQAVADTVERRVPAEPHGEVTISNTAGEVRVLGWERDEVLVKADLGSGVERLAVQGRGGRTGIVVQPKHGGHSASSDLVVHVPRDSSLSINTVSADQIIESVRGAQRLQAVSGSIITQAWGREFEARTVSGDVSVQGHGGPGVMRVTTVSGDVSLQDSAMALELNSVSGDMEVSAERLARARIKTTNGDLELTAALASDAGIEAEAINGDLRFHLREPIDAQFDIETFNGDIDNCFGPEPRRTREFGPGNELRFTQGEGSARVRIQTLNGTVEVCRK